MAQEKNPFKLNENVKMFRKFFILMEIQDMKNLLLYKNIKITQVTLTHKYTHEIDKLN